MNLSARFVDASNLWIYNYSNSDRLSFHYDHDERIIPDRIGQDQAIYDPTFTAELANIEAHERELTSYALEQMQTIPDMRIFGSADAGKRDAVISFLVGEIHHLDMGTLLDRLGIAVRTGHHCAEPLMHRLGINGTVRASFALYNTKEEIDILVNGIRRVSQMF